MLGKSPSQLWFLFMLFWIFVIFWPISNIITNRKKLGLIIILVCYCIGRFGAFIPNYYCIRTGLMYLPFFYIGFVLRRWKFDWFRSIPAYVYLGVDIGLFALNIYLASNNNYIFKIINYGVAFLLEVVGAVMAFMVLQRICVRISDRNIMQSFSKYSMSIYLVHQQLIYFSIGLFGNSVHPGILVILNFMISLFVSYIFAMLMSKTKATRFLVGSK